MKTRRSAVTVSAENGLATFRLSREHGNAIDLDLVEALIDACRRTSSDSSIRGVLLASSGSLFCPGFDLQVLVDAGCRNTVFHARSCNASAAFPDLKTRGVGRFRIELVREKPDEVRKIVSAYRRLLDGRTP